MPKSLLEQLPQKPEWARHNLNPAAMNRLIYGDNLLAMAAILAGDNDTPSMRGNVHVICINPRSCPAVYLLAPECVDWIERCGPVCR